jgi:nitrite reductase/ring-hydroxylating ferredoxin subunit/Fe-S cluster biogenesis protein NfuA
MPADRPVAPDILEDVTRAITALESHPDADVRDTAGRLLAGIDAVHRAGLTHLVHAIQSMAGDAFLNRLVADPAIRLLLMSYNLVAVDRRLMAEEALDTVRGHLHDHGVDVEILEVVGGVVYVRLHGGPAAGDPAEDAVRRDLEAALRERFVGFQELVLRERSPTGAPSAVVPLDALRRARRPVYQDVAALDGLPPGGLTAVRIGDVPVLLASVGGDIHAVRNQCGDSPLPLEFGTLEGAELRCSWHGCRYDVRSGHRADGQPGRLQVFPVSVEDGRVRVALDVAAAGGGES